MTRRLGLFEVSFVIFAFILVTLPTDTHSYADSKLLSKRDTGGGHDHGGHDHGGHGHGGHGHGGHGHGDGGAHHGGSGYISAKDRLDSLIHYLISQLPHKINVAKATIESDIKETRYKRITQGWSIVVASWKDILSDFVINERTLTNFGGLPTLYNYGFLGAYGIGFGFPLLLGLPEEQLTCDSSTFNQLIKKYGLEHGVSGFFPSYDSSTSDSLASRISEFDLISHFKLDCIIGKTDDYEAAAEVEYALDELIAALNFRLALEE